MHSRHVGRMKGGPRDLSIGVALLSALAGCGRTDRSTGTAGPDAAIAIDSPDATALIQRLRAQFRKKSPPQPRPGSSQPPATPEVPAIGGGTSSIVRVADRLELNRPPHLRSGLAHAAEVQLPSKGGRPFHLRDVASGVAAGIVLDQAPGQDAETSAGLVVYRAADTSQPNVIHRPGPEGTEDFIHFEAQPSRDQVTYTIELGDAVAGLRLVSNVLELVDAGGRPRLRMSRPWLIGSDQRQVRASVSVDDCAVDRDPSAPWKHTPVPPGARVCHVRIAWNQIAYPALLDPAWQTTGSMTEARYFHTATFLPDGTVLIAGGNTASAELYDPSSGTFSTTDDMNAPRLTHTALFVDATQSVVVVGGNTTGSVESWKDGQWTTLPGTVGSRAFQGVAPIPDGSGGVRGAIVCGGYENIFGPSPLDNCARVIFQSQWTISPYPSMIEARAGFTLDRVGTVLVAVGGLTSGGANSLTYEWNASPDSDTSSWSAFPASSATCPPPPGCAIPAGCTVPVGFPAPTVPPPTGCPSLGQSNPWIRSVQSSLVIAGAGSDAHLYLFGGAVTSATTAFLDSVVAFAPASGTWSRIGALSVARAANTVNWLPGGRVVVAGGEGVSNSALGSTDLFDPATSALSSQHDMLTARLGHAAATLADGSVLVTGGEDPNGSGILDSAELFVDQATGSSIHLSTDETSYPAGTTSIAVSYDGLPSSSGFALAIQDQQGALVGNWQDVNGVSGTAGFQNLAPGTYVVVISNDHSTVLAQSAAFTIDAFSQPLIQLSTSQTIYPAGTTGVAVWYSGLPSGIGYEMALKTPQGQLVDGWQGLFGTEGTADFTGLTVGTYIAVVSDNYSTALAQSAPFTIAGIPITEPDGNTDDGNGIFTDHSSYAPRTPVTITFAGSVNDPWSYIGLSYVGDPYDQPVLQKQINGARDGSVVFDEVPPGTYIARILYSKYLPNGSQGIGIWFESAPFTITDLPKPPTVATDACQHHSGSPTGDDCWYEWGEPITVSFAGMLGSRDDFVELTFDDPLLSGDPQIDHKIIQELTSTDSATEGTITFGNGSGTGSYVLDHLAPGSYTATAHFIWGDHARAISLPFSVKGPPTPTTLTSTKQVYYAGQYIGGVFQNMLGNTYDRIGVSRPGAPTGYSEPGALLEEWAPYNQVNGNLWLGGGFEPGTYVLRAFYATAEESNAPLAAESAPFTLIAPMAATVSTDRSIYSQGDPVVVSFSDMPGDPGDVIAFALPGSDDFDSVESISTGGWDHPGPSTGTISVTDLPPGTYVARALYSFVSHKMGESSPFTVTASTPVVLSDHLSYASAAPITISFANMPVTPGGSIVITSAGAPDDTFFVSQPTNGAAGGALTFATPLPPGAYVARSFDGNNQRQAESPVFTIAAPSPTTTVASAQASYASGASIVVTFANMLGNGGDYVTVALAGSPDSDSLASLPTNGALAGTLTFSVLLPPGEYVARAYYANTNVKQAESATFAVRAPATAVQLSTDRSSYAANQPIVVTFANMLGDPKDWIALAAANSSDDSYLVWQNTGGAANGSVTFATPLPAGNYVVRAFFAGTSIKQAEGAPFTIGAPANSATLVSDQADYPERQAIRITFAHMLGNVGDRIALARPGSADSAAIVSQSSLAAQSGSLLFNTILPPGQYVARAYFAGTSTRQAESAPFNVDSPSDPTLATTVSTDHASYASMAPVTVYFANMLGAGSDWIAIATAGSPDGAYVAFQYTGGALSGSLTFATPLGAGSYVARAYFANSSLTQAESVVFTVAGAATKPTLSADATDYAARASVSATFANMLGGAGDSIAIAVAGAPDSATVAVQPTGGAISGKLVFSTPLPAGSYVLRAFFTGSHAKQVESAAFTIEAPTQPTVVTVLDAVYSSHQLVSAYYSGMLGNAGDTVVIAAAGSGDGSAIEIRNTNGALAGFMSLGPLPAGQYVVRAFFGGSSLKQAESAVVTVNDGGASGSCAADAQCGTGHCVLGLCCDTACGACGTCNAPGHPGICTTLPVGSAGTPSCSPAVCDGHDVSCPGQCRFDADCISGSKCSANHCTKQSIPPALAGFPLTSTGLPIIMQSSAGLSNGTTLLLAYDPNANSPATDWARCLDLVVTCARSDGLPTAPCIDSLPTCPSADGSNCCPAACIAAFDQALGTSGTELDAITASFSKGDCVPGLTAYRNQEGQQ